MEENNSTRRKFLKFLGLSTVATISGAKLLASSLISTDDVKKLNPEQKTFMLRYGKWMDEFIEVIKIQKLDPDNLDNKHKLMKLTEESEVWQPRLNKYMHDKDFAAIYSASIQKMSQEIN